MISARLTDIWVGQCCCHNHPNCQAMSGPIITSSQNVYSLSLGQARLWDMTVGSCGHTGMIITASPNCTANVRGKARVADSVTGCNIGIIVTGAPTHFINEAGPTSEYATPYWAIQFEGQTIVFNEVDFGNVDDEEHNDDGLNVYPPVSGTPTAAQIAKSEALEVAPTTTVEQNTEQPVAEETPPTACDSVPTPPPDNFQLSTNFNLGQLSTAAVVSHYPVKAQAGLTVPDIVCNLQALAQNVLEDIATQYGRARMIITSGFRYGSGSSQHERGQAADVQFPTYTNKQIYDVAVWIKGNVAFDQLILEYGGNRPWIHVSFNRAGNRPTGASNKFGTRTSAGSYVWGQLLNRA